MKQKEIIEKIRKIRFGIGLSTENLTDEQKEALEDKKKILEDTSKLAKEIHTKNPHFILELIQNAEDNEYREIEPTVRFILDKDILVIQNNEKGFSEENVQALCGIGGSTKKNKSFGYIGEKGIGFKSVFMIADKVHIYSNGFQFGFDYDKKRPETMIIPKWIDEIPELVNPMQTNIVLYLNPEIKNELSKYFEEIHPSILLFLKKLKKIQIIERDKGKVKDMNRHNKNDVIEIISGKEKSYWKIYRKSFAVPKEIHEERREGVKETEIILAFPLKENFYPDISNEQPVFAFLPIRNYGFKFIIQADFLLPITREDIIKDNVWNRWLGNSVVDTFICAINEFKNNEKLRHRFYEYFPVDEIRDDFFLPIVGQIYERLKNEECILTETNVWKKPSDVLFGDEEIKRIVTNKDLQEFLGKEYLSNRVNVKRTILSKLGIQELSVDNLLEFLEITDWVKKQNNEWFANLFIYLGGKKLSDEQFERLKNLSILKLENEELTSINKGTIFYQLDKKVAYSFESELKVLNREILDIITHQEKEKKNKTINFLHKLGLKQADPYEVIEEHILPIYENGDWEQKDSEILIGYIKYIKDNIYKYEKEKDRKLNSDEELPEPKENPLERLKKVLQIRIDIDDGEEWYDNPEDIYLSRRYGNENKLEELFQGIDVNFVHPCYIESDIKPIEKKISELEKRLKNMSKKHRKKHKKDKKQIAQLREEIDKKVVEWKKFFLKIGLWETIMVKTDPETEIDEGPRYANNSVTKKSIGMTKKKNTLWKNEDWHSTDWIYYIENDWVSPHLESLLNKINKMDDVKALELSKRLFAIISEHWDSYKTKLETTYYYRYSGQQGWSWSNTKSTFYLLLLKNAWLPTTQSTLAKPSEIFLNEPKIHNVLGDVVPYLAIKTKNEDFIKQLGINMQPNIDGVLSRLMSLVEQEDKDKEKFEILYNFLDTHFEDNADKIKEAFNKYSFIFIPNSENGYYKTGDVMWKNLDSIFGKNKIYLEKYYKQKFRKFFVEKIGISEKPAPKDYADVLCYISEKDNITDEDKNIIVKVYEELDNNLNPDKNETPISQESWWEDFIDKPVFLTDKDEFWCNEKDIFINDSNAYEVFKDEEDLGFLWLPKNYNPYKIKHFIEDTHLRYLSESVKIEPLLEGLSSSRNNDYTKRTRNIFQYVLQYLYWKEHDRYKELRSRKTLNRIAAITVYETENLKVRHSIEVGGWQTIQKESEKECIYHSKQNRIYMKSGCDIYSLAAEFAKVFGKINGLDDFIMNILSNATPNDIKHILDIKNIKDLPESEKDFLKSLTENTEPDKESESMEDITEENQSKSKAEKPHIGRKDTETEKTDQIQSERAEILSRNSLRESKIKTVVSSNKEVENDATIDNWKEEISPKEAPINIEEYNFHKKLKDKEIADVNQIPSERISTFGNEVSANSANQILIVGDLSEKDKMKIGRWGEEYVFESIKSKMQDKYKEASLEATTNGFRLKRNNNIIVEAIWLNKYGESRKHYDIKIVEKGKEIFIEVKSTKEQDKSWFQVSKDQWKLIEEKGNGFHIYRVYGAGTKEVRVIKIPNPAELWKEGKIYAYPMGVEI